MVVFFQNFPFRGIEWGKEEKKKMGRKEACEGKRTGSERERERKERTGKKR